MEGCIVINSNEIKRVSELRAVIEGFINNRLQDKLEKGKNNEELEKIRRLYQLDNWLADAARRVGQIQLVTHGIKFLNPDARGSSIYLISRAAGEKSYFISTSTLGNRMEDVVGNAAALDVFKFLQIDYEGKTLLNRARENDSILFSALPGTDIQKAEWVAAFAKIIQPKGEPATHALAKQIYFPIGNNKYHLIAPLFPTSLVHHVFKKIQSRFDETTKEARKAKREKKPYASGCQEFINLTVQNFGGSKPQNISQLNSVRGGKCYLLPSLPPKWKSQGLKPPLNVKTIFSKFSFRVRHQTKVLRKFLLKNKDRTNISIRDFRRELVAEICDQLLLFAAQIQQMPGGWSAKSECKLSLSQVYWLDPGRAATDKEWEKERQLSDWKEDVCHDFAVWLNESLESDVLHFGDPEYEAWHKLLDHELSLLREAIS